MMASTKSLRKLCPTSLLSHGPRLPFLYPAACLSLLQQQQTQQQQQQQQQQCRSYQTASRVKPKRKPLRQSKTKHLGEMTAPRLSDADLKNIFSNELFIFRSDVNAGQIAEAMRGFTKLKDLEVFTQDDMSNLARQIHFRYRTEKDASLLSHVKTLIEALQSKQVPAHPLASVHVLSCLKSMEEWHLGNEYWNWLRIQDEDVTDSRVYGAAIELLTFQGAPLAELEAIYQQAKDRYSKVAHDGGGHMRRPTRVMLMQGIITARVFHGEWRSAYNALSQCLEMHPSMTPSRVYELFIIMRPAVEGHVLFMMACRAGVQMPTKVLSRITSTYLSETNDYLGTIQLVCAYAASGGKLEPEHLNVIVKALLMSIPRNGGTTSLTRDEQSSGEKKETSDSSNSAETMPYIELIRKTVSIFRSQNVALNAGTYNTIIIEGGKLRRRDIVHNGLSEMLNASMEPSLVTYRCLIQAFGLLDESSEVRESWWTLCALREQLKKNMNNSQILERSTWRAPRTLSWDLKDWQALIKACLQTNQLPFLLDELEKYDFEMNDNEVDLIKTKLRSEQGRLAREKKELAQSKNLGQAQQNEASKDSADTLQSSKEKVQSQSIQELQFAIHKLQRTVSSSNRQDFTNDIFLLGTSALENMDENTKKLYHEFSQRDYDPDISRAPGEHAEESNVSITGIPYNHLRFLNWMSINKLIYLGEYREIEEIRRIRSSKQTVGFTDAGYNIHLKPSTGPVHRTTGYAAEEMALERIRKVKEMMKVYDEKKKKGENVDDFMALMRSAVVGGKGRDERATYVQDWRQRHEPMTFGGPGGRQIGS